MNEINYEQHLAAVRLEIIQQMNLLSPKSIIPEVMYTRLQTANNEFEVTRMMRAMCGEGLIEISPCSENAYIIKGAKPEPGIRRRVVRTAPKKYNNITDAVFYHLFMHGPKSTPDLEKEFGPSLRTFISRLKAAKLIECVDKIGPAKIWAVTGTVGKKYYDSEECRALAKESIDEPAQEKPENEETVEIKQAAEPESVTSDSGSTDGLKFLEDDHLDDLVDEDTFMRNTNSSRIIHILNAIDARSKANKSIPNYWVSELKRRWSDGATRDN